MKVLIIDKSKQDQDYLHKILVVEYLQNMILKQMFQENLQDLIWMQY